MYILFYPEALNPSLMKINAEISIKNTPCQKPAKNQMSRCHR
jgi:hypothetical protein